MPIQAHGTLWVPLAGTICNVYEDQRDARNHDYMLQAILARIDEDSGTLSRRGEDLLKSDEASTGLDHPRNRRGKDY